MLSALLNIKITDGETAIIKVLGKNYPRLTGLFFGGKSLKIYNLNERQGAFMLITGLAFTHMTYKATSSLWKTGGAFIGTVLATRTIMSFIAKANDDEWFAVVREKDLSSKGCFSQKKYVSKSRYFRKNCYIHVTLLYALLVLCAVNYIARPGFEHLAGWMLSSEMANVTAFVMTSLVLIYSAKSCGDGQDHYFNASTISAFTGFIAFCIVAALIRYNLYSFSNPMLALKAIPIFFACMEAIHEEDYLTKNQQTLDTPLKCLLGGIILTAGFVYADAIAKVGAECLAEWVASNATLAAYNISADTAGRVAEFLIAPMVIIAASIGCRSICNEIGGTIKL